MNYSTDQRQALALAFRSVLDVLWDGKRKQRQGTFKYICLALGVKAPKEIRAAAQALVRKRLTYEKQTYYSVYSYLRYYVGVRDYLLTDVNVQEFRRLWLLELIKEFES